MRAIAWGGDNCPNGRGTASNRGDRGRALGRKNASTVSLTRHLFQISSRIGIGKLVFSLDKSRYGDSRVKSCIFFCPDVKGTMLYGGDRMNAA